MNLVPTLPAYGTLRIVNGGLGVYAKENDMTSATTLTAVSLSNGSTNPITLGSSSSGAASNLTAESGHVFFARRADFSSPTAIYDWVPGSSPAAGLTIVGSSGLTLAVSPDRQSVAVNGNWGFPPSGDQFHSATSGTLPFPDNDKFGSIFVGNGTVLYETPATMENPAEIMFWVPAGGSGVPIYFSIGSVPAGWEVSSIAGTYGIRVLQDLTEQSAWLAIAPEGLVLQSDDTFFRNLLTTYQIDPSGFPTITGGAVAGETGDFVFTAGGQQYYVTAVPEPSAIALLSTAIVLGVFVLRRARKQESP
ncbi:MAG TPA: PEP-CTERM sorting domain-containing protein [Chthoniobacterales bacterium]